MPRLGDLVSTLNEWFDPGWAESWDAVGLVCGDPDEPVDRILLAVDPVSGTVDEAISTGAQLLITHHPLLLTPVHGVPANDPRGALVHRMIRSRVAHFVAHTNADVADPGVSDALGELVGLRDMVPVLPQSDSALIKLVVFVPNDDAQRLIDRLAAAGAGAIGDYDRCVWTTLGQGSFRPLPGAQPAIGAVGKVSEVAETRVEMVVQSARLADVMTALRLAHPYEEPAFDLLAQVGAPTRRGTGRVGELAEAMTLTAFTAHAAAVLPATSWGVRAAGDPERVITRAAVCGGSGGGYAAAALAAGAQVLLTSDLKHHVALDAVGDQPGGGLALVDAAHWATEAPWLHAVAGRLRDRFGTKVEVQVSRLVTDPWTVHAPSPESSHIPT